jgi:hypothetical protein
LLSNYCAKILLQFLIQEMLQIGANDDIVARGTDSHLCEAIVRLRPKLDEFSFRPIGNGIMTFGSRKDYVLVSWTCIFLCSFERPRFVLWWMNLVCGSWVVTWMVWWCGVLEGLTYTRRLPVRAIELYIDSLVVVNAITSDEYDSWRGRFLVEKIHHLLVLDWEVVVHHSYRKANRCANTLAIDGFKGLFIWITNINHLLLIDLLISTTRVISI